MTVTDFLSKPSVALPIATTLIWFSYLACVAIYRLFLHPLSKFPGPKLAALTRWYEFYYEVPSKGQFTFHIQELHKKYGPIIRVTPDELHVQDSDYWDELYARNTRADKYEWTAGRFGNNGSIFTTSAHDLHRTRRAALNPLFSKRSILNFQPVIRKKVEYLCDKLATYKDSGKPVAINNAWSALAGDVITEYSFGIGYNHLESEDFKESFHEAFMAVSEFGHVALQFPWVHPVLNMIPDETNEKMNPPLTMLLKLQRDLKVKITAIANGTEEKKAEHTTIFHELLSSDLPPADKAIPRMTDEAQTIIGAGLETTAWALSHATFYIINNPEINGKLREELIKAIPDPAAALEWLQIEKLPYLTACIREAIRMSYGVSARNPRVLEKQTVYKDWKIPAKTPISMTIIDVHHDEKIFPDSFSYIPERWLGSPKAPNGSPLDRYFVAFGKGTRSCLGINLAHCELYLALAAIFRRFTFELYETDATDVLLAHDFFLPSPKLDTKGVRVKILSDDLKA